MYCIYRLLFSNGKSYVGQTKNYKTRMKFYVAGANSRQPLVAKAIAKHSFIYGVIRDGLTKIEANREEVYYIDHYKSANGGGYNIELGGNNVSAIVRAKMRDTMRKKMTIMMSNKDYREKCLTALKSNEKQRLKAVSSEIYCTETGEWFKSISQAARELGCNRAGLSFHLNRYKHYASYLGLHFEYMEKKCN